MMFSKELPVRSSKSVGTWGEGWLCGYAVVRKTTFNLSKFGQQARKLYLARSTALETCDSAD